MPRILAALVVVAALAAVSLSQDELPGGTVPKPRFVSVAIQTCNMKAMEAFYSEAFGGTFKDAQVGPLKCRFGEVAGVQIKLVPLRKAADFEGYPTHQLGFSVGDIEMTVAAAKKHGGKLEGELASRNTGHGIERIGCVRDPDGNTIELTSLEK